VFIGGTCRTIEGTINSDGAVCDGISETTKMSKVKQLPEQSDSEMTVIMFKLKGNDATMQDGLRTFAAALRGIAPPINPAQSLPAPKSKLRQQNGSAAPSEQPKLFDTDEDLSAELEADDSDVTSDVEVPVAREKASNGVPRKLPKMSIVPDLDLHPKDKLSLADFVEQKKPKSQYDQIVVFVYYLCKTIGLQSPSYNHVYSCFKDDGVKIEPPDDLPQIIRNCRSKKGWVEINDGTVTISNKGESYLEHHLPRKAKAT
jgi:hypothetical protein